MGTSTSRGIDEALGAGSAASGVAEGEDPGVEPSGSATEDVEVRGLDVSVPDAELVSTASPSG